MNDTEIVTDNGIPKETVSDKIESWLDRWFNWIILTCGLVTTTVVFNWFKSPKWDFHNWIIFLACHIAFFVIGAVIGFILIVFGGWLLQKICDQVFGAHQTK